MRNLVCLPEDRCLSFQTTLLTLVKVGQPWPKEGHLVEDARLSMVRTFRALSGNPRHLGQTTRPPRRHMSWGGTGFISCNIPAGLRQTKSMLTGPGRLARATVVREVLLL